jgi:hypothetical protein
VTRLRAGPYAVRCGPDTRPRADLHGWATALRPRCGGRLVRLPLASQFRVRPCGDPCLRDSAPHRRGRRSTCDPRSFGPRDQPASTSFRQARPAAPSGAPPSHPYSSNDAGAVCPAAQRHEVEAGAGAAEAGPQRLATRSSRHRIGLRPGRHHPCADAGARDDTARDGLFCSAGPSAVVAPGRFARGEPFGVGPRRQEPRAHRPAQEVSLGARPSRRRRSRSASSRAGSRRWDPAAPLRAVRRSPRRLEPRRRGE